MGLLTDGVNRIHNEFATIGLRLTPFWIILRSEVTQRIRPDLRSAMAPTALQTASD
jgi:hypothetical protein